MYIYDSQNRLISQIGLSKLDYIFDKYGHVKKISGIISDSSYNVFGSIINRSYDNGLIQQFIYDEETDRYKEIGRVLTDFLNASYIVKRNGDMAYGLTRLGYEELPIWAAFAKTFIESYWIAVRSYVQMGKEISKRNELLKNMSQLGLRYYKIGFIDHVEGVSQINFENAIRIIREEILPLKPTSDGDDSEVQERLLEFAQRLHDLSHY